MTLNRWRCEEYLQWVASLPCSRCGLDDGCQAHHFKGAGQLSGASLKAPDFWTMPLCPACHDNFHRHLNKTLARRQYIWVAKTLALFMQLVIEGLGEEHMKLLVKGIRRNNVIGGH